MHLIGPLQNNKTTKAAELFHAVDTLDSFKTAERLNRAAAALNKIIPVLIEVKLSPEETKHGVAPEELPAFLDQLTSLDHVTVRGLMTVPPWSEDAETARPYFQQLRRLRDELQPKHPDTDRALHGHDQRLPRRHRRGLDDRPHRHGHLRQARVRMTVRPIRAAARSPSGFTPAQSATPSPALMMTL